jgi:hypothetical protein
LASKFLRRNKTVQEAVSYVKLKYILNLIEVFVEGGAQYIEDNQEYVLPDYTCTIGNKAVDNPQQQNNYNKILYFYL